MSSHAHSAPLQFSEVILRTRRFEAMKQWYQALFGGLEPSVEADTQRRMKSLPHVERLCLLRIHVSFPYTQVLGIFEVPDADDARRMQDGRDYRPGSHSG